MRRFAVLLLVVCALALPAAASAQTTFAVKGAEIAISPATFTGPAYMNGTVVGSWYAQAPHTPLSNNPATPASICTPADPPPCGSFVLAAGTQVFSGAFLGGTITFAGLIASGDGCPDETYHVEGTLTDGSFDVLLRHHRKFPLLGCPIVAGTVAGTAELS